MCRRSIQVCLNTLTFFLVIFVITSSWVATITWGVVIVIVTSIMAVTIILIILLSIVTSCLYMTTNVLHQSLPQHNAVCRKLTTLDWDLNKGHHKNTSEAVDTSGWERIVDCSCLLVDNFVVDKSLLGRIGMMGSSETNRTGLIERSKDEYMAQPVELVERRENMEARAFAQPRTMKPVPAVPVEKYTAWLRLYNPDVLVL